MLITGGIDANGNRNGGGWWIGRRDIGATDQENVIHVKDRDGGSALDLKPNAIEVGGGTYAESGKRQSFLAPGILWQGSQSNRRLSRAVARGSNGDVLVATGPAIYPEREV